MAQHRSPRTLSTTTTAGRSANPGRTPSLLTTELATEPETTTTRPDLPDRQRNKSRGRGAFARGLSSSSAAAIAKAARRARKARQTPRPAHLSPRDAQHARG